MVGSLLGSKFLKTCGPPVSLKKTVKRGFSNPSSKKCNKDDKAEKKVKPKIIKPSLQFSQLSLTMAGLPYGL